MCFIKLLFSCVDLITNQIREEPNGIFTTNRYCTKHSFLDGYPGNWGVNGTLSIFCRLEKQRKKLHKENLLKDLKDEKDEKLEKV